MTNLATALLEVVGLVEVTPHGHIGYSPDQLAPHAARFFAVHGEALARAVEDAGRLDFIEDADNAADIGIYGITVGVKNLRERIDAAIATTEKGHDVS